MAGIKRYTHHEMHQLLCDRLLSERYRSEDTDGWIAEQAEFCPYYVEVTGPLAADWGVILNPNSTRFGQLTFEHDHCGCPAEDHPNYVSDQTGTEWMRPRTERLRWRTLLFGGNFDAR